MQNKVKVMYKTMYIISAHFRGGFRGDASTKISHLRSHDNRRKSFAGKADGVFGRDRMSDGEQEAQWRMLLIDKPP